MNRIYLDHAATSWPKSDVILNEVDRFARQIGATAGRGGYHSGVAASTIVDDLRRSIVHAIGGAIPQSITLLANGTLALNAAIHGIVRPGDHVVTTASEHNSVLRPLRHLELHQAVKVTIVPCDAQGQVSADSVVAAVTPQTRLVAVCSASNVTGAVQPIEEIGARLADHPCAFLCDAAQTFGYVRIDVRQSHVDMLASPGHKGGCGPAGTGFLYVDPRWHDQMIPHVQGGTGASSESLEPLGYPQGFEVGNLNVPALAGWLAGLQNDYDPTSTHSKLVERAKYLNQKLDEVEGLRRFGRCDRLPIASFDMRFLGLAPHDIASILNAEFGIEVRSGFHCAALIHQLIGAVDGTVRISAGPNTPLCEIDAIADALSTIAMEMKTTTR